MLENLDFAQYKFGNFFWMNATNQLITDIKGGEIAPIYFLMGEEAYYIDAISDYIESHVLAEEEKRNWDCDFIAQASTW